MFGGKRGRSIGMAFGAISEVIGELQSAAGAAEPAPQRDARVDRDHIGNATWADPHVPGTGSGADCTLPAATAIA